MAGRMEVWMAKMTELQTEFEKAFGRVFVSVSRKVSV